MKARILITSLALAGTLFSNTVNAWFFFWIPGSVISAVADALTGSEGNDVLDGRGGVDSLRGGAGRDLFHARDGRADTLVGGPARDTARLDRGRDRAFSIERRLP